MTFDKTDIPGILLFTLFTVALTVALSFVPIGDASGGIGIVSVTVPHGGLP